MGRPYTDTRETLGELIMIEKIWNKCSKIDLVALIVIVTAGLFGLNFVAAGVALSMAVYHTYKAYNG